MKSKKQLSIESENINRPESARRNTISARPAMVAKEKKELEKSSQRNSKSGVSKKRAEKLARSLIPTHKKESTKISIFKPCASESKGAPVRAPCQGIFWPNIKKSEKDNAKNNNLQCLCVGK